MKRTYTIRLEDSSIKNLNKVAKQNNRQPREFARLLIEEIVDKRASVKLSFLSKS